MALLTTKLYLNNFFIFLLPIKYYSLVRIIIIFLSKSGVIKGRLRGRSGDLRGLEVILRNYNDLLKKIFMDWID